MRQTNAVFNAALMFGPFVLLAFMVLATTPRFWVSAVAALYLIGFSLLTISKLSVFRDGSWISFGPSKMDAKNRQRYRLAYRIIGLGMLINIVSLLVFTR